MNRPKTSNGFYHVSSSKKDEPIEMMLDEETLKRIEKAVLKYTQARTPQVTKQVKVVQGPPGKVIRVVKRVATPEPDKVVNVTYVEQQRDRVDLEILKPRTPSPTIEEVKIIKDKKLPPEIKPRVKQVLSQRSQSKLSQTSNRKSTTGMIFSAWNPLQQQQQQQVPTYSGTYYPIYNRPYHAPQSQWNQYSFNGFF